MSYPEFILGLTFFYVLATFSAYIDSTDMISCCDYEYTNRVNQHKEITAV